MNLRIRLKLLDELWLQGVNAHKVIIACSKRPLFDIEDTRNLLNQAASSVPFRKGWMTPHIFPKTQEEVAKLIWDQTITCDALRNKDIQFLIVENTVNSKTRRHANTEDTLNAWLNQELDPGDILAISNNPYIGYQHAKLRNVVYKFNLSNHCSFETVGKRAEPNIPIRIYLDTLARWFDTDLEFLNEIHSNLHT